MRTINAPGVEWREIDKSGYSPAMTGTACWIPGFADKGEPYKPMEFTSRTALTNYYGEPDNEAERYFYAACCEVLNQNGRLWTCRLPYDNDAFEKMVGFKYSVTRDKKVEGVYSTITEADSEIKECAEIETTSSPIAYKLSEIDEFRTGENKVPAGTFLIVDTTGATYGKVTEDSRKGQSREVIGLVPIVTTAANAMYAQSLIQVGISAVSAYEPICGDFLKSLKFQSETGGQPLENAGLSSIDMVRLLNTTGYFSDNKTAKTNVQCYTNISVLPDGTTKSEAETAVRNNPDKYNCISAYKISEGWEVSSLARLGNDEWFVQISGFGIDDWPEGEETTINEEIAKFNASATKFSYSCKADAINIGLKAAQETINSWSIEGVNNLSTYANPYVDCRKSAVEQTFKSSDQSEAQAKITEWTALSDIYSSISEEPYHVDGADKIAALSAYQDMQEVALSPTDSRYGWHGKDGDDSVPTTMALDAANYFSTIQPAADGVGFDPECLKDIGVVVYKTYLDPAEGNKVSYEPVEAFCGSLYKDAKDPNTGVTKFIDTIINSQSQYINFFSNCFNSKADKEWYLNTCDILISKPSIGGVLGFYETMTKEDISVSKSIYDGLNKGFEKIKDLNLLDIDIVCDAGIANIASFLKAVYGDKGAYDLTVTDDLGNPLINLWKATNATDASTKTWKTVEQKFDNFCKNVRKDCMFAADGLRPLVLQGDKKIVRDSKPSNTIDANILPYLKTITGLNTSYCGLYMDWFEVADDYTGDFFWCPPSIKAMGVMINTDVNYNYWDAPAGLNRGKVAAVDVAFSPTIQQAGSIYEKCINYAMNYPSDGIILEGQKTTQVKPSAFDRINVRRLFCRLERAVYKVSRYFVYETNTAYTRQRYVDAIDPYFKECKLGGGCYDYKIVCDESNNTSDTIDRNELHVSIGIKPVKTIEFIMIDFVATSTGASWEEAGL